MNHFDQLIADFATKIVDEANPQIVKYELKKRNTRSKQIDIRMYDHERGRPRRIRNDNNERKTSTEATTDNGNSSITT